MHEVTGVLGIDELKIVGAGRCMRTNIEKDSMFDLQAGIGFAMRRTLLAVIHRRHTLKASHEKRVFLQSVNPFSAPFAKHVAAGRCRKWPGAGRAGAPRGGGRGGCRARHG